MSLLLCKGKIEPPTVLEGYGKWRPHKEHKNFKIFTLTNMKVYICIYTLVCVYIHYNRFFLQKLYAYRCIKTAQYDCDCAVNPAI